MYINSKMFGIKKDNDNLEKIKQEVKGSTTPEEEKTNFEIPLPPKAPEINNSNNFGTQMPEKNDINIPNPQNNQNTKENNMFNLSHEDLNLPQKSFEYPTHEQTNPTENLDENSIEDLSYQKISKSNYNFNFMKKKEEKPVFIKTRQYQSLLESIEEVKSKIKNSYDTYLKLSELKTEEDIEVENLRKEFEEIESRLYKIDQILFEN